MNFLIYADDFYQVYKRGVANYGFNLIKSLKKENHKVFIYSRGESDLSKKQLRSISNRIAFSNELLKEIVYYGKYSLKIKKINKYKLFFKRIYFNLASILSINSLIKYESIDLHFNSIDDYPSWDGFYNDKFFRFKAYYAEKFKTPLKFRVPKSIDYVISISPQNLKVIGAPLISIFHDALPISSPHHLEEDSKKATMRFNSAIKNSSKILHVSEITKKDIEFIFSKQLKKKNSTFSKHVGQSILSELDIENFNKLFENYEKSSYYVNSSISPVSNFVESEVKIPYVVNIGAIEPRKNQDNLIKHLQPLLKERKIRLALIGKPAEGGYYSKVKKMIDDINAFDSFVQVRERNDYRDLKIYKKGKRKDKISKLDLKPYKPIICLQNLNNWEVNYVLQGALCLVQYSSSEGFGIPLVEACKNTCPVICSDIEIFKEVGSFINIDRNDPRSLIQQILFLLNQDLGSRKEIILKQFKSVKKHSYSSYNEKFFKKCKEIENNNNFFKRIFSL